MEIKPENRILREMLGDLAKISKALSEANDETRQAELREVYRNLRAKYTKQKQWVEALESEGA